eukprot:CAMPEP_0202767660 /NCGR_PEP_ID=MMETSP1388-20130828/33263_1 /ASSEMBLY_ACC=CAM_ASM_000864 /TAXON_ID=37098 /ORGANISM="Isochrysis sp, Strain CCMP1244" /LENGTH=42 /DNA_ID= /DNA_START= /DNA_END= /DNA_ORIENTATION=
MSPNESEGGPGVVDSMPRDTRGHEGSRKRRARPHRLGAHHVL